MHGAQWPVLQLVESLSLQSPEQLNRPIAFPLVDPRSVGGYLSIELLLIEQELFIKYFMLYKKEYSFINISELNFEKPYNEIGDSVLNFSSIINFFGKPIILKMKKNGF